VVTLIFKLTEVGRVSINLPTPLSLCEVVERSVAQSGYRPGGYIAVRGGRVIGAETMIADGDHIDIFPALSGG
jgi:molybdopterin converting factor small subunit